MGTQDKGKEKGTQKVAKRTLMEKRKAKQDKRNAR